MEFLSVFVALFLIMDPFGNIPVFLAVLDKVAPERRKKVLIRELMFALAAVIVCIVAGRQIVGLMGLEPEAISIAGGIILFLIAVQMIYPFKIFETRDEADGEPLLVPLAIPLIAGPSLMAVLLLFASSESPDFTTLSLAALSAWFLTSLILYFSTCLLRVLGKNGLTAIARLMGMILVAISIQLFLDGISLYSRHQ
ncbi:MAG: NAAT family transporter [Acidobacteria bacterium]|nr:NAAT family transporter [Acidobacteriota bacterium]